MYVFCLLSSVGCSMTLQNQTNGIQDDIVNIKIRNRESERWKNSLKILQKKKHAS